MKQFNNFKAEKAYSGREILPAGGYVCNILSAKEEQLSWGSRLVLAIDVAEGEKAGFFKKDFDANPREDRKWRGTFRINVPKDDGSEEDAWPMSVFKNFIWAVEASNPGYTWNWDEKTLKGKKIGVVYREREWAMGDRIGWTTEAGKAESVDDIRNGSFKALKAKPLKERPIASNPAEDDLDDQLPF